MPSFRAACAQYPIEELKSWDEYGEKLSWWVSKAALEGARLLVFPEYAAMELASLMPLEVQMNVRAQLEGMQLYRRGLIDLHRSLAEQHGVYILAGSMPVLKDGRYLNRAYLFGPNGARGHQDKLMMTRFERESWGVSGGHGLEVFQTELGVLGVTVCYDVEFPLIARRLCEAGADVLLVPSCTETLHGYHRVRTGARARALENQCCALMAPLVGDAPWSEAIDFGRGAAGVFTPIDAAFPENGVLVDGPLNQPTWVYADVVLEPFYRSRVDGQTLNSRDWLESSALMGLPVGVVKV